MSLKSDMLRDLVTEYRKEQDKDAKKKLGERILVRVDKLLIAKVSEMKARRKDLARIDIQDLYHCAIIGFFRSLNSIKDTYDYTGDAIQSRIISYIKEEVRKTYLCKKQRINPVDQETIKIIQPGDTQEFIRADFNDFLNCIRQMQSTGEISKGDFRMIMDKFVSGLSYCEIGRRIGLHYVTVSKRVRHAMKLIAGKINGEKV